MNLRGKKKTANIPSNFKILKFQMVIMTNPILGGTKLRQSWDHSKELRNEMKITSVEKALTKREKEKAMCYPDFLSFALFHLLFFSAFWGLRGKQQR